MVSVLPQPVGPVSSAAKRGRRSKRSSRSGRNKSTFSRRTQVIEHPVRPADVSLGDHVGNAAAIHEAVPLPIFLGHDAEGDVPSRTNQQPGRRHERAGGAGVSTGAAACSSRRSFCNITSTSVSLNLAQERALPGRRAAVGREAQDDAALGIEVNGHAGRGVRRREHADATRDNVPGRPA